MDTEILPQLFHFMSQEIKSLINSNFLNGTQVSCQIFYCLHHSRFINTSILPTFLFLSTNQFCVKLFNTENIIIQRSIQERGRNICYPAYYSQQLNLSSDGYEAEFGVLFLILTPTQPFFLVFFMDFPQGNGTIDHRPQKIVSHSCQFSCMSF